MPYPTSGRIGVGPVNLRNSPRLAHQSLSESPRRNTYVSPSTSFVKSYPFVLTSSGGTFCPGGIGVGPQGGTVNLGRSSKAYATAVVGDGQWSKFMSTVPEGPVLLPFQRMVPSRLVTIAGGTCGSTRPKIREGCGLVPSHEPRSQHCVSEVEKTHATQSALVMQVVQHASADGADVPFGYSGTRSQPLPSVCSCGLHCFCGAEALGTCTRYDVVASQTPELEEFSTRIGMPLNSSRPTTLNVERFSNPLGPRGCGRLRLRI